MDPVVIRAARGDDVEPVLSLWDRAAGPTMLPGTPDAVLLLIERDPHALIVADHAGEIVGTLIVGWDGWRCHLYRLAVRDDFRRRHIASDLVAHARARARAIGARRLDAMVDGENALGISFWSGIGFTTLAPEDRRWTSPV